MESSREVFQDLKCIRLSNGELSVWLTTSFGLRVIGLAMEGRENLLAALPEAKIERPDGEDYWLRGGHRLWYAPENPATTYIPDNQPVETIIKQESVEQIQPVDGATGIQKSWEISLPEEGTRVVIDHRLTNQGDAQRRLAPWAITMLRPGGVGMCPQKTTPADANGLLPNRHLVLWPYTPMKSGYLHWGDETIFVEADMREGALKIGFPNPAGWLAYNLDGRLFLKESTFDPTADYFDRGASSEVYCCADFIELETLGPAVDLAPGESVVHQEAWQLFQEGRWPEEVLERFGKYQGELG